LWRPVGPQSAAKSLCPVAAFVERAIACADQEGRQVRNGSDPIEPTAAERVTAAGMADLLAMCSKISRLEAAQAGITAKPADVVKFLDATIESLLSFAGKLLVLKRIYESRSND
jgi:hypothetical protein